MKKPTLFRLLLDDPLDTHGWSLTFTDLLTPMRSSHSIEGLTERLFESPDSKYACLFYTVTEITNGSYGGLIALYENKLSPRLLANPAEQWFRYSFDSTLTFDNELLILRKPAFNKIPELSGCPFVVIDLERKQFAFIDFDFTAIYYNLIRKDDTTLEVEVSFPREIEISKMPLQTGHQFNLNELKYYSLEKLNQCTELYQAEKAAMNVSHPPER